MQILLSNDDGIMAPGLKIIYELLKELGHDVFVFAPQLPHSGTSHSITLDGPLIPKKIFNGTEFFGIAINGTPADSVKLALAEYCPAVDLVISGINLGNNAGPAIYYSGTVAAAFEASVIGKTALAISLNSFKEEAFTGLKEKIRPFLPIILSECTDKLLYNVNIPKTPVIKGIEVTRQFQVYFTDQYEKRIDPRKREYFWLKNVSHSDEAAEYRKCEYRSDLESIEDGYISITPLQFDLTQYKKLECLKEKVRKNQS